VPKLIDTDNASDYSMVDPNTQYCSGGTIDNKRYQEQSADTCANRCNLNAICNGFIYSKANKWCFLKFNKITTCINKAENVDRNSDTYYQFDRNDERNSIPTLEQGSTLPFELSPNMEQYCYDMLIGNRQNSADVNNCAQKCEANGACNSFIYNKSHKFCYISTLIQNECTNPRAANRAAGDFYFQFDRTDARRDLAASLDTEANNYTVDKTNNQYCSDGILGNRMSRHTPDQCANKCTTNSSCKSFIYDQANQLCILNTLNSSTCTLKDADRTRSDYYFQFDKN